MQKNSARILIVDDEEKIREMLQRGLTRAMYDCITAQSARQAAKLLEQEHFDLVLLDINMPGKSGMDYLPEITTQFPDIAVVMLTGYIDVATAVRAMREGAYDYATKPVTLAEIIIRTESALSRRALLLENREYHQRLERIVDELNQRLEQRKRELAALNNLFQSHVVQSETTHEAYSRLQQSLVSFNSELKDLASIVGLVRSDNPEPVATQSLSGSL